MFVSDRSSLVLVALLPFNLIFTASVNMFISNHSASIFTFHYTRVIFYFPARRIVLSISPYSRIKFGASAQHQPSYLLDLQLENSQSAKDVCS